MRPVRPLLLTTAALLAAPVSVLAAPGTALVNTDPTLVDVSSDGRYVLFSSGLFLDRTTGLTRSTPVSHADFSVLDLASTSPKGLVQVGQELWVVDYPRGLAQSANRDGDGTGVLVPAAYGGKLIRNAAAVLFTTAGDDPSIVEFDLASQTYATRMEHARLLDASEDGRVITFSRALPTEQRPAGTYAPATGRGSGARDPDPIGGATGVAVGYRVGAGAPHLVSRSSFVQTLSYAGSDTCEGQFLRTSYIDPSALFVSQDGTRGAYTLYLGAVKSDSVYPDRATTWSRLTPDGSTVLASSVYPRPSDRLWNDPLSGAYGVLSIGGSFGQLRHARWVGKDGVEHTPTLPSGAIANAASVVPFAGGLHAAFSTAALVGGPDASTYDQEVEPLGDDVTPWVELPRVTDPELTGAERIDGTWASCTPAATPTPTATSTPTPTPTASPTPSPTPDPATAKFSYSLQGSTSINTLTKGSIPLTGRIDAELNVATGDYIAATTINDTQGRLTTLGFLPVTVSIGIVPSGPTTGRLDDDQLTAKLKARIKVKSVKAFGVIPLAGGNSCQSRNLSDIALASTGAFDPTGTGGTIGGSYAISDLNGCGVLNGLVSPLTAGAGNAITAKLTPILE